VKFTRDAGDRDNPVHAVCILFYLYFICIYFKRIVSVGSNCYVRVDVIPNELVIW
jgi:hypothetical protein